MALWCAGFSHKESVPSSKLGVATVRGQALEASWSHKPA